MGWVELPWSIAHLLNKYGLGELDTVTVLSRCWLGATSDHPQDQETVVTNT